MTDQQHQHQEQQQQSSSHRRRSLQPGSTTTTTTTTTTTNDEMILNSLQVYHDLWLQSTNVTRPIGSNIDIITTPLGDEIGICHLSVLLPLSAGNKVPFRRAFEDTSSAILAAHHLNIGDGSIVPEVEGLNTKCPIKFTIETADSEYNAGIALGNVVEQTKRFPHNGKYNDPIANKQVPCAFIGASRSAVSMPTSLVTGLFQYPQISAASTSVRLDDISQYPMFGRTIPPDQGNAIPFIQYMNDFLQLRHLAVVNVNDAYGNAYAEGLRAAAKQFAPNMNLIQIPIDEDGDEEAIQSAISTLKATGYRYVFALVFSIDTHDALMTEAYRQDVAGNGKHNWIFGDSFLGVVTGREFVEGSPTHLAYRGAGLLEIAGGVPGVPRYDDFVQQVSELNNPTDINYMSTIYPHHDDPAWRTTTTNLSPNILQEDGFLKPVTSSFAPLTYEAVIALGLSACSAARNETTSEITLGFTGQSHYDHFKATEFTSFSGTVFFDPITGSRDPNSALYKVTNHYDSEQVTIKPITGERMITFQPTITHLYQNSIWEQQQPYIFNDGTSTIPLDLAPIVEDEGFNLPLLIGLPAGALLLLGVIIFLFYEHQRKQNDSVWHVKKSELTFPDEKVVIGSGTFGEVLLAEYRGTQVAVKCVIPPKRRSTGSGIGEHSTRPGDDSERGHGDDPELGTATNMLRSGSASSVNTVNTITTTNGGDGGGGSSAAGSKSGGSGFSSSGYNSGMHSRMGTQSSMGGGGGFGMKSIMFGGVGSDMATRKKLKQDFVEEMRYLSKLRHPCVTTVMGAVIDRGEEPMLVMEYMDHGSLYDLLHNETMVIEGELLLPILRDVSQGIRFLHTADPQVIHGDLKSQNILVDNRFRAKVADFGLSQKKNLGGTGTPFWMAPELLREESTNTAATDVFSFGIILYEVYSRRDPYEGEDPEEVIRLVADKLIKKRPPVPRHMPAKVQSLMEECLDDDPTIRPTFEEVDIRCKRIDAESVVPVGQNKIANISLFDIFPRHVAEALQAGRTVEAEHRDCVTIFFSDIVGFTDISSTLEPRKVANMLDRLYTVFDALSNEHDIFKVETIGDAYMAVSNLVKDQPDDHCKRIAQFAIAAVRGANDVQIDMDDPSKGFVNIRVGFHSGSVVADVVGTKNPRYCLFGDTVNTASRMESNSKVNRIHCSQAAARILREQAPEIPCRSRGVIPIKGKGKMKTYWIDDKSERTSVVKIKSINMLGEVETKDQYHDSSFRVPKGDPALKSLKDRASFIMGPLAESEFSSAFNMSSDIDMVPSSEFD